MKMDIILIFQLAILSLFVHKTKEWNLSINFFLTGDICSWHMQRFSGVLCLISAMGFSGVQRLQFEMHYCTKFAFSIVKRSKNFCLMKFSWYLWVLWETLLKVQISKKCLCKNGNFCFLFLAKLHFNFFFAHVSIAEQMQILVSELDSVPFWAPLMELLTTLWH